MQGVDKGRGKIGAWVAGKGSKVEVGADSSSAAPPQPPMVHESVYDAWDDDDIATPASTIPLTTPSPSSTDDDTGGTNTNNIMKDVPLRDWSLEFRTILALPSTSTKQVTSTHTLSISTFFIQ